MLSLHGLIVAALTYLFLLFLIAYRVETRRHEGWAWRHHPVIYALALTVFFTGWSYFSAGSSLLTVGLPFLAIQIGASFAYLFGWPLLMRAIRIANDHHVTTLPSLLAVRYGPSRLLTTFVSVLLVVGMLPYIALQLAALAFAFQTLASPANGLGTRGSEGIVLLLTVVLAAFSILFGARRADPTLRHEGISVALAIDGVVKMSALGLVAALAIARFPDLLSSLADPGVWPTLLIGSTSFNTQGNWLGYLLISMGAVAMLPPMFHLTVVEFAQPRQLLSARWALPLYSWTFYLLLLPIALAGLKIGLSGADNQAAVLLLPQGAPSPIYTLIAYLGGVAAAAGMAIASLIALTNLVTIDLVLPLVSRLATRIAPFLLPLRWTILLGLALLAYGIWWLSDIRILSQFGMVSFVAASQVAPAFFLGLVWPGLRRPAVTCGLGLAALTWAYTSLLPGLSHTSPLVRPLIEHGPFGLAWLRPTALFGMQGLDPNVHAFFWCSALNLGAILVCTLWRPASVEEEQRTRDLLDARPTYPRLYKRFLRDVTLPEIERVLYKYLAEETAREHLGRLRSALAGADLPDDTKLLMARSEVERALSGPFGASVAAEIVRTELPVSEQALPDAMEAYQKLEQMLQLSQEGLASRVRELSLLNEISDQLVATREPGEILEAVGTLLQDALHFDVVGSLIFEGDAARMCCLHGAQQLTTGPFVIPPDTPMAVALSSGRLMVQTDAEERDPIARLEGAKTLIYLPVVSGGHAEGMLVCGLRTSAAYLSPGLKKLLQSVANELAVSLSEARHRAQEDSMRRQLMTTLNNLADAVLTVDRDRRALMVNQALVQLIQAPSQDFFFQADLTKLGLRLALRDLSGSRFAPEQMPTAQAFEGRTVHMMARLTGLHGAEYVLSITSVPVFDKDGAVAQVVTVYRDVTELYGLKEELEHRVVERTEELAAERDRLRSTNERLEQAIADLRSLDRVKGIFVNAISHDLRIPLTGIVGYAEFMEDGIGGKLTEQQLQFVREILQASERMTGLLNELLDFARVEAGKIKIEPRPVDLGDLIRRTISTFHPVAEKKGVRLETSLLEPVPCLHADPDRLMQVLSNLVSNGIKFTPSGGSVRVLVRAGDASVVTEVADTGIGIPQSALPFMFERFYQTEAGQQAGGTGLGLSIAKSLIEAHGGEISVTSQEGHGTTFRFVLPAAEREDCRG